MATDKSTAKSSPTSMTLRLSCGRTSGVGNTSFQQTSNTLNVYQASQIYDQLNANSIAFASNNTNVVNSVN